MLIYIDLVTTSYHAPQDVIARLRMRSTSYYFAPDLPRTEQENIVEFMLESTNAWNKVLKELQAIYQQLR